MRSVERIVLQPNSAVAHLRGELRHMGWHIVDEALPQERHRFYPVIAAERLPNAASHEHCPQLEAADLAFGPILRQKRPEALVRMLQRDARLLQSRLCRISTDDVNAHAVQRAQSALELVNVELRTSCS